MPIKTYRPTTPTRRFQTVVSREDITKDTPEKSLVESKQRTGGRSSTTPFPAGTITGQVCSPTPNSIASAINRSLRVEKRAREAPPET